MKKKLTSESTIKGASFLKLIKVAQGLEFSHYLLHGDYLNIILWLIEDNCFTEEHKKALIEEYPIIGINDSEEEIKNKIFRMHEQGYAISEVGFHVLNLIESQIGKCNFIKEEERITKEYFVKKIQNKVSGFEKEMGKKLADEENELKHQMEKGFKQESFTGKQVTNIVNRILYIVEALDQVVFLSSRSNRTSTDYI